MGALVLALSTALGMAACTPAPDGPPAPDASPATTTAPPAEEIAPGPPSPSAEPTTTAEPAAFVLGAGSAGGVPIGAPAAPSSFEPSLGPASMTPDEYLCGPSSEASWGSLTVQFVDGELQGWVVAGDSALPEGVTLPHDVSLGDPLSTVLALPGAGDPWHFESLDVWITTVVSDDGAVEYHTASDAPDSPVFFIGANVMLCD